MHVTMEESGGMTALLSIKIEESDYRDEVEQQLREQRRSLSMPGFRPGKVPAGIVNRMVGKSILTKTVINMVYKTMTSYLQENELHLLGQPLPKQNEEHAFDWDLQKEFEFSFELGFAPQLNPSLEDLEPVQYYRVKVDNEAVDKYISDYSKELGSFVETDTIQEADDMISASFIELDEAGQEKEGIDQLQSKFTLKQVKDEETKALLTGMKVGETTILNPEKATTDVNTAPYLIGARRDDGHNPSADYKISIEKIEELEPMPVDEAFYAKIYPGQEFATEQDFREAVRQSIADLYDKEIRVFFFHLCQKALLSQLEVPLPEDFLKRWLIDQNEGKLSAEELEKEFPQFLKSMRWHLLEDAILTKFDQQITREDISDFFVEDMQRRMQLPAEMMTESMTSRLQEMADKFVEEGKFVDEIEKEISKTRLTNIFMDHIPRLEEEVTVDELEQKFSNSNTEQE